jgi:hypothetical protein
VRRFLTILLFGLYLASATETYQLLKMPLLVQHFIKHKADNPETTLFAFLEMHYAQPQTYDDDWQQDMQLPFKVHDVEFHSLPVICVHEQTPDTRAPERLLPAHEPSMLSMVGYSSRYPGKIFQPPRLSFLS